MGRKIVIKSIEDTKNFARETAKDLHSGDVLALIGDLGTGKTTLSQYLAEYLGVKEKVTSPTFNIVNQYEGERDTIYHFDVYRIEGEEDYQERGLEDYFYLGGICLVEWADMIAEILPDNTKCIFLEYGEKPGERIYRCTF